MPFTVTCSCGKKLAAREEHVGKRAKCPDCGQMLLIGAPPKRPPAPPESADTVGAGGTGTVIHAAAGSSPPVYDGHRLEYWLDLLASSEANERRRAADVLTGVGLEAESELALLIARSRSPHVLVRHWATVCTGQIGAAAKEAFEPMLERLDDEQPLVREKAVKVIEQLLPEARPFLPRLVRELDDSDAERRRRAIEVFRRDVKTAGVSRFRFWACTCGRVFIKLDLEERLRKLVEAPDEVHWEGKRACGQCNAPYDDRDIYAGKFDVPEQHWSKLRSKFGKQLSVPDDFFDDTKEASGYRISDDAGELAGATSPGAFSLAFESVIAAEGDEGYALADAPVNPPLYGVLGATSATAQRPELVPGATVPESGKYKCTACSKRRLSTPAEGAGKSPPRASVVMAFKAGKEFSECPKCGELTEWEFLG
ncbi:MAG TPA: HEAT repeat domain-containing protein [Pirellulales bacterium]|nr:HEAT repeat domain-containing protein [Pirellulales bacterium]